MKLVLSLSTGKSFKDRKINGLRLESRPHPEAQPPEGNNPMVGATVAVAVAVENAQK